MCRLRALPSLSFACIPYSCTFINWCVSIPAYVWLTAHDHQLAFDVLQAKLAELLDLVETNLVDEAAIHQKTTAKSLGGRGTGRAQLPLRYQMEIERKSPMLTACIIASNSVHMRVRKQDNLSYPGLRHRLNILSFHLKCPHPLFAEILHVTVGHQTISILHK